MSEPSQCHCFAGDRNAVSRFLCRKHPTVFRTQAAAHTFISRTIKRAKNDDNRPTAEKMKDQRSLGKQRKRSVTENQEVLQVLEQTLTPHNGNLQKALREVNRLGLKASKESLRKMAWRNGFGWVKAWHTDVLTPAQKYKRKLFCQKLLRLSKANLLRLITTWMFTDEKWFDIVGPSPGQWSRAPTKDGRKMENQV